MQLEIFQWLVPLLSIFYIIRTVKQYSLGKYSPRNTIIWITFWVGVALLAIMPDTIGHSLVIGLGFRDHINAIIFVALGLLFLMVFYLSAALNRVENQLTDLVRKLALSEVHQNPQNPIQNDQPIMENAKEIEKEIPPIPPTDTNDILNDIEELENIVKNLVPSTTDENPDSIPSEGKMPKSTPKE